MLNLLKYLFCCNCFKKKNKHKYKLIPRNDFLGTSVRGKYYKTNTNTTLELSNIIVPDSSDSDSEIEEDFNNSYAKFHSCSSTTQEVINFPSEDVLSPSSDNILPRRDPATTVTSFIETEQVSSV